MKFLPCFILLILTGFCKAQTTLLNTINEGTPGLYKYKVYGQDRLFLFTGTNNDFNDAWAIDLKQGTKQKLATGLPYCQSLLFNSKGAFFISYEESGPDAGNHYINFMKPDGTTSRNGVINLHFSNPLKYLPYGAVICDDRYYIIGYNGQHCVWESDGTPAGTKAIFSSPDKIIALQQWNGKILFGTTQTSQYELYSYTHNSPGPVVFKTFPYTGFSSTFAITGSNNHHFYFISYNNQANAYTLWQSDLSDTGTIPFRQNERASFIYFFNDTFIIGREWNYDYYDLYQGVLSQPDSVKKIPYTHNIDSRSAQVEGKYGDYLLINSVASGRELARRGDSISLLEDLAPGPFSGILNAAGNYFYDSSELYFAGSKKARPDFYLYHVVGDSLRSLFKIPPGKLQEFFVHDAHAYLFYYATDTLLLYKRNLAITDAPEPTPQKERKEEWHRQLFLYNKYSISPGLGGEFAYPIDVQSDVQENVITGFSIRGYSTLLSVFSSDTTMVSPVNGGFFIAKHNKYGELQWTNSVGAVDANYYFFKLTVDAKGDVILLGIFFQEAIFENDTLREPRAAFFLAKLDGQTGKIRWKKQFGPSYYSNTISADGVVCDTDGNIYITFLYDEFDFSIDGHSLHADRSPANALVKLDADGNVLWAKNTLTPWKDYYGFTNNLLWDEQQKQVISAQSQGNYRFWSSCKFHDWHYYIQQVKADGEMNGTYEFTGDDLGGIGAMTLNKLGYLYLSGFFRGKLETGSDVFNSAEHNDCNRTENFSLLWGTSTYAVRSSQASHLNYFFPFDAVSDESFMYVIGSEDNNGRLLQRLVIHKYDLYGRLVAKKILNKPVNAFDFGYHNYLAIQKDHLVVMGYNYNDDGVYPVYTNPGIPYVSVLRMKKNEGWQEVYDYPAVAQEARVSVSPNPTTGPIGLTFLDENTYTEAEVFDLKGVSLFFTQVSGGYQNIDLSVFEDGMYFIRLKGPKSQHTVKVVKRSF